MNFLIKWIKWDKELIMLKTKQSRRRFVNNVFDAMMHISIGLLLLMVMDSKAWGVVGVLSSSMLKRITMWCMDWIDDGDDGVDYFKPEGDEYTKEEVEAWSDYFDRMEYYEKKKEEKKETI